MTKTARNIEVQTPGQVDAPEAAPAKPKANDQVMPKERVREHQDYRTMRAADIDPATLTSPVLTLDGYLCPLPPEAKK